MWAPQAHEGHPLATLRTASGEYTADPLEVDKIAAEAWDPIFSPLNDDPWAAVERLP
jgi:hypothetical protein